MLATFHTLAALPALLALFVAVFSYLVAESDATCDEVGYRVRCDAEEPIAVRATTAHEMRLVMAYALPRICPTMHAKRVDALARLGLRAAPVDCVPSVVRALGDTHRAPAWLADLGLRAAPDMVLVSDTAPRASLTSEASTVVADMERIMMGTAETIVCEAPEGAINATPVSLASAQEETDPMPLPASASNPAYRAWRSRKAARASAEKRRARKATACVYPKPARTVAYQARTVSYLN